MKEFWKKVNALLEKHQDEIIFSGDEPDREGRGYLQIEANGKIYKSIEVGDHGEVVWVCWEPFYILGHFAGIKDTEATVKWVSQ